MVKLSSPLLWGPKRRTGEMLAEGCAFAAGANATVVAARPTHNASAVNTALAVGESVCAVNIFTLADMEPWG